MSDPALALLLFSVVVLILGGSLWPRVGVLARVVRLSRLGDRIRLEDALKHVLMCQESGQSCTIESLAGQLELSRGKAASVLSRLAEMGLIQIGSSGLTLTVEGLQSAVRIVRTHRLWESYLADRTGIPATEWHDQAEQKEHELSSEQADVLESRLGHPSWDPHGDPIPNSSGEMPPAPGIQLAEAEPGSVVEIVHLEDEPREIYDSLLTDGFELGWRLEVLEQGDKGVRVRVGKREWTVDPLVSRNISIRPLPRGQHLVEESETLLDAQPGETVQVTGISRNCRGPQRRRLLDLGLVRGAKVTPELVSATGDPVAYRVKGALIALRRPQASWISVERLVSRDHESVEVA